MRIILKNLDIFIKLQIKSESIVIKWAIFNTLFTCSLVLACGLGLYDYIEIASLLMPVVFIVSFILIFIFEMISLKKIEKEEIYKQLQAYLAIKNPDVKLYIDTQDKTYNAGAAKDRYIILSKGWYDYAKKENNCRFVEATLCHELYHLSLNHSFIKTSISALFIYKLRLLGSKKRTNYIIESWKEEFEADRYGYELYENKDVFIAKMEFMQNKSSHKNRITDHPTWNLRIKYLKDGTVPTRQKVEKDYFKFAFRGTNPVVSEEITDEIYRNE